MKSNKTDQERARDSAVRMLSVRARSRADLGKALAKKDFLPAVIEEALDWLVERRWLDDAEYARAYVRGRVSSHGRSRLLGDLRRKGIDPGTARAACDAELGPEDAAAAAMDLAQRRAKSMTKLDRATAYRRLSGFLMRRGYSSDVVRRVLDRALPRGGYHDEE